MSTIQPAAFNTSGGPAAGGACEAGDGSLDDSAAFSARLQTLKDKPAEVELALMARRYHDSWKILRSAPDLTVSFLFVPSDPAFKPLVLKRTHPVKGLTLELTLPSDYPESAARLTCSAAGLPAAHREAIAGVAQDFLTTAAIPGRIR